jgi:hypothetical protein
MFVTASYSRISALDLKTGAKPWKYEYRLPDGIMPCCDVVNRGAALRNGFFYVVDARDGVGQFPRTGRFGVGVQAGDRLSPGAGAAP